MTEFKTGQRVRVEYEGTVISAGDSTLQLAPDHYPAGQTQMVQVSGPSFKVTPLGPPGWPPQAGDIWRTPEGEWFARPSVLGDGHMTLISANQEIRALDSEIEFRALNPVLVRRRGQ